jgi:Conjugative transposon protein TcpC
LIRGATLRGKGGAQLLMQRILRALLVGVLLVLLLLGVRDLLRPFVPLLASRQTPAADPAASYPREGAEAFAIRFALAYETYDGAHPGARQKALAPYLADGADLAMGWDGNGKQSALQGLPSGINVRDAHQAQVTVAVLIDNGRWVYLSVPVIADQGAFAVAAAPALVPPPGKATSTPASLDLNFEKDSALSTQLRSSATTFFSAYARSSTTDLDYYSAPGVHFVGLGGAVDLAELTSLSVAEGPPEQRVAVASVRWLDRASGASFVQPYRLELVLYADRWLVSQITPGR